MLAAVLGGVGALVAGRFARPDVASAAAGDPLILGSVVNNAGTSNTQLLTNSTDVAFRLVQSGGGTALMGQVTPTVGNGRGVYGRTDSPDGDGVQARNGATGAGAGAGMRAFGGLNHGVVASTTNNAKYAVHGTGANGTAIYGTATQVGVEGVGYRGVKGTASASFASAGVWGQGGTGTDNYGVLGEVNNASGRGVYGINHANSATSFGVVGETDATTTGAAGVRGEDAGGLNISNGVWGLTNSTSGNGVYGLAVQSSTLNYGVYGFGTGNSYGVVGESGTGVAVQAFGNAGVSGDLDVIGTVSKGGGTFKIDHPLDPANKYLLHSFVESPDMKNVYDGVVTLDGKGEATVDLPAYFDALNKDFRYQLTAIGQAAPDLHIKSKARNNKFSIAGGAAGQEVSWLVTGIRQDAYAKAHPVVVELAKEGAEKGRYLHPTENGVANSKALVGASRRAAKD
ncbi:MAG TPA: hypothetical protein VGR23_07675 [Candidatus Dormibacteraeota bacterium]|nr:hypothetical protein [Candidatus Dormibacteraeota bacterium]